MLKIIFYFIKITLRKLLSKDDIFGMLLLLISYFSIAILFFFNYSHFKNYIFLCFSIPIFFHLDRNDFELLKVKKNYRILIFVEYFIYCLPFYLVLLLKEEFLLASIISLFYIGLVSIPKLNFKTIPYPFQLFNVFWHICFRKYKFILALPIVIALIVMSKIYNNENLIYFSFLILVVICCSPCFEREKLDEIKINPFDAKKYLFYQFKNSIINSFYLLIPVIIALICISKFELLLVTLVILVIPLVNILLKYVHFYNPLMHEISFISFAVLSFTLFGLPLLLIPLLHKKAIKTLTIIKYANH